MYTHIYINTYNYVCTCGREPRQVISNCCRASVLVDPILGRHYKGTARDGFSGQLSWEWRGSYDVKHHDWRTDWTQIVHRYHFVRRLCVLTKLFTHGTRPSHSSLYRLIKVCAAKFARLADSCACVFLPCNSTEKILQLITTHTKLSQNSRYAWAWACINIRSTASTYSAIWMLMLFPQRHTFNNIDVCVDSTISRCIAAYLKTSKLRGASAEAIQSPCVFAFTHAYSSCIIWLSCAVIIGNHISSMTSSVSASNCVHDVCILYIICYVAGNM